MKLSDFDYCLPKERIAQYPLKRRESSRLCVINRSLKEIRHMIFSDIVEYFHDGDLIVLNDTKVFPARLHGLKPSGGKTEILLLRKLKADTWEAIVKGMNKGEIILEGGITAKVYPSNGRVRVRFAGEDIENSLSNIACMALPPYIKRDAELSDMDRYQTVYADKEGSVAAPTAGLHFTDSIIDALENKGVEVRRLTLHIGYGTFKPVRADDVGDHHMDEEFYEVPEQTADAVNRAKSDGRRVIAVGTSVTRTLEASVSGLNSIKSGPGNTSIFMYPGYEFRIVDALVTNFHQPKSTPMMLTSAFSGHELLKTAYSETMSKGYRFFSYGDSMFII
jgi:S-adenosylmethionine:tRNA ribosyltransferase-isomerase